MVAAVGAAVVVVVLLAVVVAIGVASASVGLVRLEGCLGVGPSHGSKPGPGSRAC